MLAVKLSLKVVKRHRVIGPVGQCFETTLCFFEVHEILKGIEGLQVFDGHERSHGFTVAFNDGALTGEGGARDGFAEALAHLAGG